MSAVSYPRSKRSSTTEQVLVALLLGIVLFFIFSALALVVFQVAYAGRIFPGVRAGGIDLAGLTPSEAAAEVTRGYAYPRTGRILLQDGAQAWQATPAELGLYVDPETTAGVAFQIGRSSNLFDNLLTQLRNANTQVHLPVVLVFDQRLARQYLDRLASQINKPMVETSIGLNGLEVSVRQGQVGREMDTNATLELLAKKLQSGEDGVIPLPILETSPLITDVSAQVELAKKILSAPLELSLPGGQPDKHGPWKFDVPTLVKMLAFERINQGESAKYEVTVNSSQLRAFLTQLAPTLVLSPANAKFIFNDKTRQLEVIQPAVIGRALDIEATLRAVQQKLSKGDHTIALELKLTPPPATDKTTAEQLGIKELVYQEISYFYGSSAARIQNIKTASSRFHGVLVPPGAVFSMSDTIGTISLDSGYAEALIIQNGRTIQGVGGGVCQVSTTLFRAAFFAGFPIVERYAHAYRVSYYEKVAGNKINAKLAGLDATVFVPIVDFKFKNDTSSWLLMETYVNTATSTLTWNFYSTSDGRKVKWETTGLTNIVKAPDPVYRENPDLPKDKIKQIDYAVEGADVTVTRTVTRNGQTIIKDTVRTHYVPWPDQFEYGPGTEIPTPEPKD